MGRGIPEGLSFRQFDSHLNAQDVKNSDEMRADKNGGGAYAHKTGIWSGLRNWASGNARRNGANYNSDSLAADLIERRKNDAQYDNVKMDGDYEKEMSRAYRRREFKQDLHGALQRSYGTRFADGAFRVVGAEKDTGHAMSGEQYKEIRLLAASFEKHLDQHLGTENYRFLDAVTKLGQLDAHEKTEMLRQGLKDVIDRFTSGNNEKPINISAHAMTQIKMDRQRVDQMQPHELVQLRNSLGSAANYIERNYVNAAKTQFAQAMKDYEDVKNGQNPDDIPNWRVPDPVAFFKARGKANHYFQLRQPQPRDQQPAGIGHAHFAPPVFDESQRAQMGKLSRRILSMHMRAGYPQWDAAKALAQCASGESRDKDALINTLNDGLEELRAEEQNSPAQPVLLDKLIKAFTDALRTIGVEPRQAADIVEEDRDNNIAAPANNDPHAVHGRGSDASEAANGDQYNNWDNIQLRQHYGGSPEGYAVDLGDGLPKQPQVHPHVDEGYPRTQLDAEMSPPSSARNSVDIITPDADDDHADDFEVISSSDPIFTNDGRSDDVNLWNGAQPQVTRGRDNSMDDMYQDGEHEVEETKGE